MHVVNTAKAAVKGHAQVCFCSHGEEEETEVIIHVADACRKWPLLRACLQGGGGPQAGEATCGGSHHVSYKRDQIKMRVYMGRRFAPPKRVTSLTWGSPPLYKQALSHDFKYGTLTWLC